jgi:flagellar motility protein MotE (MotC chaperone)
VEEFLGLQFDLVDNLTRGREKALEELSKAEKEKSGALFKLSKTHQRVKELENALQKGYEGWEKREEAIRNNGFFTRLKYLLTGELV